MKKPSKSKPNLSHDELVRTAMSHMRGASEEGMRQDLDDHAYSNMIGKYSNTHDEIDNAVTSALKKFKGNIKEEVDITPYVERGLVGVNVDAVRDNINTFLNGALGKCFITPYVGLERTRKVLANFHIFLPRTTFLEGDRGVEVFDIKQFGEAMGMRNDGTVVTKMSDPYSLYFEYKMNDRGMFDVFAEIVTKDELDDLMKAVEADMDDDAEDDREDRLDESSESVKMSGPETGARRIAGQPDYGMAPDYEDTCEAKPKMKLVMKKGALAEGEVIQGKFPKNGDKSKSAPTDNSARVIKLRPNYDLYVHPNKQKSTEKTPKVDNFSKGLRTPKRNAEIEAQRPKTNWVDKALEQDSKPKSGLLKRLKGLFKEEDEVKMPDPHQMAGVQPPSAKTLETRQKVADVSGELGRHVPGFSGINKLSQGNVSGGLADLAVDTAATASGIGLAKVAGTALSGVPKTVASFAAKRTPGSVGQHAKDSLNESSKPKLTLRKKKV